MDCKPLISIAYADDHPIVRKGIVSFIHELGGIVVSIDAPNGKDLIQQIEKAEIKPDICILDINMPVMNGFDTIIELKKRWPTIGVLILTVYETEFYLLRMVLEGANGYLLKTCDPNEIKKAILSIYYNGMYYSEAFTRTFFNAVQARKIKLPNITAKETQVLELCCSDLSYAQIAQHIKTTTRSVEGYRDSLFKKLKINSRVSLAMFAIQFGIASLNINTSGDKNILRRCR